MKNKNKIMWIILILLVVFSLSIKFKKYILDKDFFVYMNAPCTGEYSCFQHEEVEEPYVKVYRKAFNVQHCVDSGECDPFICQQDEEDCSITICSEEELEEGEACINLETE